ncbi:MAG: phosphate acyltransferase PlsX [Armatimonadetes bacterium]|nr:phosphate acyltransferase PlsX [Armatimonadota bacterium]
MRIAVDAMGGDYAPLEIVKGAVEAAHQHGISVTLVGHRSRIEAELAKYPSAGAKVEVVHASEAIAMDDSPTNAVRRKDSSLVVAANLVNSGEAQAMVSAGNTGAAMAVATLKLGRIPGIERPAIASMIPSAKCRVVLLDAGANVDCDVHNLLQFAMMGATYAERVFGVSEPRVGLLSIGEEPSKGDKLTKGANLRLSESDLNFIGNVEGKEIFRGAADVVVCDGFAGNITLKVTEGVAEFLVAVLKEEVERSILARLGVLLMGSALRRARVYLDYAEYGGAPLLGTNGICTISHGRSSARAIRNAIRAAASAVESDVVGCITAAVRQKELVAG